MKLSAALSFVSVALFGTVASAQYSTGFEPPLFSSGQIGGQDFWTTSTNPSTARVLTASEIETELINVGATPGQTVHGGAQALVVSGAGASNATIRSTSSLLTAMEVILDVWARPLTSGSLGNIFLTMEDSNGDRAAAFRFGTAFGSSIDYGTSVAGIWQSSGVEWNTDNWYHLTLRVDYIAKTYNFAVDGVQVNVDPIPFYSAASDNFSQIRIFRGSGQAGMIVDDLSVAAIPEPSAIAWVFTGSLILLRRRR